MTSGKLVALTLISFLLFQSPLSASEDVDTLSTIKVSKEDILKSLDGLKKAGKISAADYEAAKKELIGMNDTQIDAIKETAVGVVKNNPEKADELLKAKKIDTKEVKKQIDDLSKPKD